MKSAENSENYQLTGLTTDRLYISKLTPYPSRSRRTALLPSMSATVCALTRGVILSAVLPITKMGEGRVAFHGPE